MSKTFYETINKQCEEIDSQLKVELGNKDSRENAIIKIRKDLEDLVKSHQLLQAVSTIKYSYDHLESNELKKLAIINDFQDSRSIINYACDIGESNIAEQLYDYCSLSGLCEYDVE